MGDNLQKSNQNYGVHEGFLSIYKRRINEPKELLKGVYRMKEKVFASLWITKKFDNEVASLSLLR